MRAARCDGGCEVLPVRPVHEPANGDGSGAGHRGGEPATEDSGDAVSPRRKSGLSKEDLDALKRLPAVLVAVRKVTALGLDLRAAVGAHDVPAPLAPLRLPSDLADLVAQEREAMLRDAGVTPSTRSPTLDTPERREYEEAKRNGRKVPVADPFANASPAQRERMAEQRAFLDAERAAKGLPRTVLDGVAPIRNRADLAAAIPELADEVVRTEELDTISDGTTPLADDADDESEVH